MIAIPRTDDTHEGSRGEQLSISFPLRKMADCACQNAYSAWGNTERYSTVPSQACTTRFAVPPSPPFPPPYLPFSPSAVPSGPFRGPQRRALFIGINYFIQRGQLRGCVSDAQNMASYLVGHFGYKPEDMLILTDDKKHPESQPTKQNILRAMHWLVKDACSNDTLFFYFSGQFNIRRREADPNYS